jgi:hypothetical protein
LQLQTNGGTTAVTLDTSQNATFAGKVASASSLQLATNGTTTAITVDTSQNVGIGTSSPNRPLEIKATNIGLRLNNTAAGGNAGLEILPSASVKSWLVGASYNVGNAFEITPSTTNGGTTYTTPAMTLDASGRLLNACTNNAEVAFSTQHSGTSPQGIQVTYTNASPNNSGTGNTFLYCVDTTAVRAYISGNGGIANYSANNVNLSDRREKTNFAPAKSYLNVICSIPVQTYNYINQNLETDGGLTLGVIAQDVQAVAPELVTESNWGTEETPKMRLSIYQTDLQYALMKCIQELSAQVTTLQTQVTALKG